MDILTSPQIADRMRSAMNDHVNSNRDNFCKTFVLIARFAGWKWYFEDIGIDSVYYCYDKNVSECMNSINKLNIEPGKDQIVMVSSGRIKCTILYYARYDTVQADITVDIIPNTFVVTSSVEIKV